MTMQGWMLDTVIMFEDIAIAADLLGDTWHAIYNLFQQFVLSTEDSRHALLQLQYGKQWGVTLAETDRMPCSDMM